ncbi:50S ribosomal protein L3 [Candidatus Babeliales bacterium]|nr:50S ribosomal protein L3 [Candidatus Babeliales bacterium]
MITGLWGKKVGMTQVFSEKNEVVPVTVIDTGHWFVTAIKTQDKDGYSALQCGRVRKRYEGASFDQAWLKSMKKYFVHVREISLAQDAEGFTVGQACDLASALQEGGLVDVFGVSKGRGFQGVVKRHGYSGGPATHGSTFHRLPGSISFWRSEGRVPKGKTLPGHMGAVATAVRGLRLVQVRPEDNLVLVKGAVPGSSGSCVFVRKQMGEK